jgi:hypothetical protein
MTQFRVQADNQLRNPGARVVADVELAQRFEVGRVGDRGMRDVVSVLLNDERVAVDGEDLGSAADEFQRERGAEATEPEYCDTTWSSDICASSQ